MNHDEVTGPNGKRMPGLFAYLRGLRGADDDRRRVIGTVFAGVVNRMVNGFLLRDLIDKVSDIHFTSKDEIHTLGQLYESMLKEMRDAAGDAGEFYTPRAVVRFIVEVTDPRLGETVLDPACGTGGFLVEAYRHLEKQCKTVKQRAVLQGESLYGGEAKPLPYLLAQMNLLLHGLEAPQIDPGNSLRHSLSEIGDSDRVDVILTNPPFGGEEEAGIRKNFPNDKQTSETALLFLQLIMRKLRRSPKPGRAAVVVPNGVLFGDGVCARIKEELLKNYNLHTVVRLPNGVFRAVHRHPDERPVLRSLRPYPGRLVLRAAAARRPEELHQDAAHPVRRVSRVHRLVERRPPPLHPRQSLSRRSVSQAAGWAVDARRREGDLTATGRWRAGDGAVARRGEAVARRRWGGAAQPMGRSVAAMGRWVAAMRRSVSAVGRWVAAMRRWLGAMRRWVAAVGRPWPSPASRVLRLRLPRRGSRELLTGRDRLPLRAVVLCRHRVLVEQPAGGDRHEPRDGGVAVVRVLEGADDLAQEQDLHAVFAVEGGLTGLRVRPLGRRGRGLAHGERRGGQLAGVLLVQVGEVHARDQRRVPGGSPLSQDLRE